MITRVLIPLDESETARHTVRAVMDNQDLMLQDLLLLHVVDVHLVQRLVPDIQKNMVYAAAKKAGDRVLEKLAKPFRDAGFHPRLRLELGTPAKAILEVVAEEEIQLLIIGRHPGGGGFHDIMFGSVAHHVIRAVKCPILLF